MPNLYFGAKGVKSLAKSSGLRYFQRTVLNKCAPVKCVCCWYVGMYVFLKLGSSVSPGRGRVE